MKKTDYDTIAHMKQVEIDIVEKDLQMNKKKDAESPRRRDIAKRRAKLGFNDNGAEEMEDEDILRLENQKKDVQLKIQLMQ